MAVAVLMLLLVAQGTTVPPDAMVQVRVARPDGPGGVGMEALQKPPASKPLTYRDTSAVFFSWNHNVKDAKGRIVTGLGFRTWMSGKDARVAVYALVPRAGAPNRYLAKSREELDDLEPVPFAEFNLAVGSSRKLDEMKALGMEPMLVTCARVPRKGRFWIDGRAVARLLTTVRSSARDRDPETASTRETSAGTVRPVVRSSWNAAFRRVAVPCVAAWTPAG